ncbi:hypothetical protein B0H16DRAFT_1476024 [Mycena metata]|uniref:Uncharacterized protein n=1 Tax=Mycena metata TaxID=1033252 RepID=A0AAD7HCS6_9AGAR|nr:hypothetical protein B0H16DRAFT_1476024 [Mycena metata]
MIYACPPFLFSSWSHLSLWPVRTDNSQMLTARQIVEIRKALASEGKPLNRDSEKPLTNSGMAPSDDIDKGEDADGEDDQLVDPLDEIDSTSAGFDEDKDTDGEDDELAYLLDEFDSPSGDGFFELDEIDSTSAGFFEDYSRIFGEVLSEDAADFRSEILETAELQTEVVRPEPAQPKQSPVDKTFDHPMPIISSDDSDATFLDKYLELFIADFRASLEADFVSNNFHAVFRHTKVQEFLQDFELSDIIGARTPLDLGLTQKQVEKLQAAHTDSFMESVAAVELAPEVLRAQVMEGSRYHGDPQKVFTAPRNKGSIQFYLHRERMLLLAVIKACQHQQPWPLTLSNLLEDRVTKLCAALKKSTGKKNLKKQVEEVLDMLYFPTVPMKDVGHPFRSPVVAFLATFCMTETGDWASVKNLSSFLLAPAQFAIRARGLQRLIQILQGSSSPDTDLRLQIIPFCEKHLADHGLSPFSGVRFFMQHWSIASLYIDSRYTH